MKNLLKLLVCIVIVAFTSCTSNERARNYGGSETVTLDAGQKVVNVTWKEDDMWILTRPMRAEEVAETCKFQEKSSYGIMNGTITIVETK
ncbi:MAG TPA: hypothetical protein VNX68_07645 [Nitrosopumilaceae archaeon]|jgi:hypothetical protein|nr:hypothetical protein [Nitrosopumilaceae archaeon]